MWLIGMNPNKGPNDKQVTYNLTFAEIYELFSFAMRPASGGSQNKKQ